MNQKVTVDRYLSGCVLYQWPLVDLIDTYLGYGQAFLFVPYLKKNLGSDYTLTIFAPNLTEAVYQLLRPSYYTDQYAAEILIRHYAIGGNVDVNLRLLEGWEKYQHLAFDQQKYAADFRAYLQCHTEPLDDATLLAYWRSKLPVEALGTWLLQKGLVIPIAIPLPFI